MLREAVLTEKRTNPPYVFRIISIPPLRLVGTPHRSRRNVRKSYEIVSHCVRVRSTANTASVMISQRERLADAEGGQECARSKLLLLTRGTGRTFRSVGFVVVHVLSHILEVVFAQLEANAVGCDLGVLISSVPRVGIEVSHVGPPPGSYRYVHFVNPSYSAFSKIDVSECDRIVVLELLYDLVPSRRLLTSSPSPSGSNPTYIHRLASIYVRFHERIDVILVQLSRVGPVIIRIYRMCDRCRTYRKTQYRKFRHRSPPPAAAVDGWKKIDTTRLCGLSRTYPGISMS